MMGFASELQSPQSHNALLHLQDTEIRLLENIRKCIAVRIKCDRDYATALTGMLTTAHKLDLTETKLPMYQAWSCVISETEQVIQLIRDNADQLCSHTLERLIQVIHEKKLSRRTYTEQHTRLHTELTKLEDTVKKQQVDISKQVAKVLQDRMKFEDNFNKGKVGSKLEDSRQKYTRSETKLHELHNEYVRSLEEARIQQENYTSHLLPGLLTLQEANQTQLVELSKTTLSECVSNMDLTSDKFRKFYSNMYQAVDTVSSTSEYNTFLTDHRSEPLSLAGYMYNTGLLDPYKGFLVAGELGLSDLTLPSVQHSCCLYKEQLSLCQTRKETKSEELSKLQRELTEVKAADCPPIKCYVRQRAINLLQWEVSELECSELKYKALHDLVSCKVDAGSLAPGLVFPDNIPSQLNNSDSTHFSQKITDFRSTLAKRNPFKRVPPPDSASESEGVPTENSEKTTETPSAAGEGYQQCEFPAGELSQVDGGQPTSLEDSQWFHGLLPREEVQRLLIEDGDFLVRESKNRKTKESQYVLSVMWAGHKHFIIQGEEGSWRFEAEVYPTISDLIIGQYKTGQPVTKKSEAILKNAILRPDWELSNDDIDLGDHLDKGNFGDVYCGVYKPKNLDVAIKTCRETLSEEQKRKFLQEGRILKQYDHPNIVRFIGIAAQRQPVMIVMEFVKGGCLLNYIKKNGSKLSKSKLTKMCEGAAGGMAYLETKNCIHRDLAARNCLVDEAKDLVKISDFGMSREEEEYTVSGGLKQIPIKWTAPEALNFGTYTSASDVWSFGVLMWEVFSCGKIPYPGLTNTQARERIEEGYRMPAPEGCPSKVYDMMAMCWQQEPRQRPHFSTLHENLHDIRRDTE